jgi:diguanylate cyclase (GGDEF)-like protein
LQLSDHGISREHCRIFSESNHFIIQDLNSHNGTFVNNNRVKSGILRDGDKIQIGLTTLKFAFLDEIEESYIEQMAKSAILDPLTEVYNRRYFLHQLEAEIHYSLRHHLCLSLLAIDLDHFKQINDQYGHLIGDQVLIQFAALIKDSIRTEDLLSRYGGDEFLLLVRGANQSQAMNLAERLRQQVGRCVFRSPDHSFHLTISIGVATLPSTTSVFKPIELLAAADEALYQAKRSGRDCVCI